MVVVKCAETDRRELGRSLIALGVPVLWRPAENTAAFSFRYDGDRRTMTVDAIGDPWTPDDVRGLRGTRWVHVGALAQSDFPVETVAELARGRRVLLDGQGLVRPARTGPLELSAPVATDVLEHVSVLKLAEEEARTLVGEPDEDALRSFGVPEVVVTLGSRGSLLLAGGRLERIRARPLRGVDPTGAGDGFAAAYAVSRAAGHSPRAAAQRATAVVSAVLTRRWP